MLKIFLDMDGVVANFDKGIDTWDTKIGEWRRSLREAEQQYFPEMHWKEIEKTLGAIEQRNDIEEEIYRSIKEIKKHVFRIAETEGFFLSLEKMPDADELVEGILEITKQKFDVLTAPVISPFCAKEKKQWFETYYPNTFTNFIVEKNKFLHAKPGFLLIDDTPKKVIPFREHGGQAILHINTKNTLEQLKELVCQYEG